MKKIVFLCAVVFLGISSAQMCPRLKDLHRINHKLQHYLKRNECCCCPKEINPQEVDILLTDFKRLYNDLCDDCKDFSKEHTRPLIEKVLSHFGLDGLE